MKILRMIFYNELLIVIFFLYLTAPPANESSDESESYATAEETEETEESEDDNLEFSKSFYFGYELI